MNITKPEAGFDIAPSDSDTQPTNRLDRCKYGDNVQIIN